MVLFDPTSVAASSLRDFRLVRARALRSLAVPQIFACASFCDLQFVLCNVDIVEVWRSLSSWTDSIKISSVNCQDRTREGTWWQMPVSILSVASRPLSDSL